LIEELSIKKTDATTKAGIYTFFNSDNEIIYIGKAVNLRGRFCSYISKYNECNELIKSGLDSIDFYFYLTDSVQLIVQRFYEIKKVSFEFSHGASAKKEIELIYKHNPKYNRESTSYYDEREKSARVIAKLLNSTPERMKLLIRQRAEDKMRSKLQEMNKGELHV